MAGSLLRKKAVINYISILRNLVGLQFLTMERTETLQ